MHKSYYILWLKRKCILMVYIFSPVPLSSVINRQSALYTFFHKLQRKMVQSSKSLGLMVFYSTLLVFVSVYIGSVEAYKNYTVGDSLGWYDTLEKPNVNYQKWVAGKTFSLGDFLIFKTDSNHSVIQTYNFTTYKLCDFDDALNNDTTQWSSTDPSAASPNSVYLPVPLLKVGMTYFFSSDYDGEQCKNGQHFKINVTYGQGLPKSLKEPSDEAPGPVDPESGDDQPTPATSIPSSFNNPRDITSEDDDDKDDNKASDSVSLAAFLKLYGSLLNGFLVLLGIVCIF